MLLFPHITICLIAHTSRSNMTGEAPGIALPRQGSPRQMHQVRYARDTKTNLDGDAVSGSRQCDGYGENERNESSIYSRIVST